MAITLGSSNVFTAPSLDRMSARNPATPTARWTGIARGMRKPRTNRMHRPARYYACLTKRMHRPARYYAWLTNRMHRPAQSAA